MHRALQRCAARGIRPRGSSGRAGAAGTADAERHQGNPGPVRDRPGRSETDIVRGCLQPLQTDQLRDAQSRGARRGPAKVQHPHAGADGQRQDPAGPDPGQDPECALRHRRRHDPDGSGLCGRRCGKHPPAPDPECRLRHRTGPAGHYLHRRNRQDRPQVGECVHHA